MLLYPFLLLVGFLYVKQKTQIPDWATIAFYILLSIGCMMIEPIYGVIAAIALLTLYDNQRREGFDNPGNIPRVIYQTWNTHNLPPKMAACVAKLKDDNPEFEHRLFDDTECREFIKENFAEDVVDAYDRLIPGAFKADLWRYCVLYVNGGIYMDIKFQCEPGFSFSDVKGRQFYIREYNHMGTGLYDHIMYTGCIGSTPKNPVFMKCIQRIVENVKNRYYGPEHTSPTGPYLFASVLTPEDIESSEYSYYESEGIGYVRHIENKTVILSHYPEYRGEQKTNKASGWKEAWLNREIYSV